MNGVKEKRNNARRLCIIYHIYYHGVPCRTRVTIYFEVFRTGKVEQSKVTRCVPILVLVKEKSERTSISNRGNFVRPSWSVVSTQ